MRGQEKERAKGRGMGVRWANKVATISGGRQRTGRGQGRVRSRGLGRQGSEGKGGEGLSCGRGEDMESRRCMVAGSTEEGARGDAFGVRPRWVGEESG